MLLFVFLSMLSVMCSVVATPVEDSASALIQLFPKRDAEAIPIPTLLPQPRAHPRLVSRGYQEFGSVWQGDEKKNVTNPIHEDKDDDLWCTDLETNKHGKTFKFNIVFDAICYFYEKECDPSKGKAEAVVGWEGGGSANDTIKVEHDWNINYYACHWQNKTIGTDIKIGNPNSTSTNSTKGPDILEG